MRYVRRNFIIKWILSAAALWFIFVCLIVRWVCYRRTNIKLLPFIRFPRKKKRKANDNNTQVFFSISLDKHEHSIWKLRPEYLLNNLKYFSFDLSFIIVQSRGREKEREKRGKHYIQIAANVHRHKKIFFTFFLLVLVFSSSPRRLSRS